MATDKFRFLAIECEDLPDDSLLRILSGEFNLDAITTGMTTRQIMGVIKNAPSKLSPSVYAANAPALYAFRSGPLDTRAALLEAAIPSACSATGNPSPGGIGNVALGYGYESPLELWLQDYTSNPANKGDEFALDMSSGENPGAWTPLLAPGVTVGSFLPAFTQAQVGSPFFSAFLRNCKNRAAGTYGDYSQVQGSVIDATSVLHPVCYGIKNPNLVANPTPYDLIGLIATAGGATELVIRRDSESGTVLYTGSPAGPAMFDLSCAELGAPIPFYFTFSQGGGMDEITIPCFVNIQDFDSICNP